MPAFLFDSLAGRTFLVLAVTLTFGHSAITQQSSAAFSSAAAQTPAKARVLANYGRVPLSFEVNRGQADTTVEFIAHGPGYALLLQPAEALLALRPGEPTSPAAAKPANHEGLLPQSSGELEPLLIGMRLIGTNPRAAAHPEETQITRTNYFIGNDPSRWRTDIPNYGRIRYAQIYPGVELVYHGNRGRLEHDFVVAPGAEPKRILFAFDGATATRVDSSTGDLVIAVSGGESSSALRLLKPIAYQISGGKLKRVTASYEIHSNNRIGFRVADFDRSRPLIIDPVLVYSTYIGGSGDGQGHGDQGNAIAVDSSGDAYIVGTTYSTDYPVTVGVLASKNKSAIAGNGGTVFVSKLNSSGTALIFSTYLGGSGGDYGYGIALDSSHQPFITGATYSRDFPLTCGTIRHSNDAEEESGATTLFITKLSAAGSRLEYSMFLGGTGNHATPGLGDVAQAIAVDAAGDAYVAGYTYSEDFPRTKGAFQTHFLGNATSPNAFVVKINPLGTEEMYSTLLGGNGGDFANAIALDAKGDAFVAGSTGSMNFPVTSGAFQTVLHGSSSAFVTEIDPAGADTIYSTYLGGSGGDSAQAIAVDAKGFAYVAGATSSSDFPLTSSSLEDASSGIPNYLKYIGPVGFITKLSQNASTLEYSTYVEGYGTSVLGLAIDSKGSAYLAGSVTVTNSGDLGPFKVTSDALATPTSGGKSGFLVKLNPAASVLNYATLVGGKENDFATALAMDASGDVYITGSAVSNNFPVTPGAFQSTNKEGGADGGNAFLSKFSLGNELHQTAYPAITTTLIPTVTSASCGINVETCDDGTGTGWYDTCYQWGMSPVISDGPTPTGDMEMDLNGQYGGDLYGPPYSQFTCWNHLATTTWPVSCSAGAEYSGDSVYAPSQGSGSDTEGCDPAQPLGNAQPGGRGQLLRDLRMIPAMPKDRAAEFLAKMTLHANPATAKAKFTPPPEIGATSRLSPEELRDHPDLTTACKSPLPQVTITITPAEASRVYGAANPAFGYTVSGLLNGDSLNITPGPPPDQKTPVGTYRVATMVSGAAAQYYEVNVQSAELTITPAPLTVTVLPQAASSVYGSPLPSFTYSLSGVRNQDQLTVTLNSYVGDNNRVGTYPITGVVSGAAASNYNITIDPATLKVMPATLRVWPRDAYAMAGSTLGWDYWGVTGLVNKDPSWVVSGDPGFSSNARPDSPPGYYTIYTSKGDLSASNYSFAFMTGVFNTFAPIDMGPVEAGSTTTSDVSFKYGFLNPVTSLGVLSGGLPGAVFNDALLVKQDGTYKGSFAFTPPEPGLWTGTLEILGNPPTGPSLLNIPVHGIGIGPQSVFDPGPAATIQPAGASALTSPDAVTVTDDGTLYIADAAANHIVEVKDGVASVFSRYGLNLTTPTALTVDYRGDLVVALAGREGGSLVVIPPSGNFYRQGSSEAIAPSGAHGLAADVQGNLYISDTGNNRVILLPGNPSARILSTGPLTLSSPSGLALDLAGNLYIADTGNNRIVEAAANGTASVVPTGTPALNAPTGVAVDASGTLYISETGGNSLVEVSPAGVQTTLLGAGLSGPQGIAPDHEGNLYIADTGNKRVVELKRAGSPTESFASTTVGKISGDSPKTVIIRNVGNAGLTISSVSYPADFPEDASGKGTDCRAGLTVPAAGACALTIDFKPATALTAGTSLALEENAVITSNTLNQPGTKQSITLQGTEEK